MLCSTRKMLEYWYLHMFDGQGEGTYGREYNEPFDHYQVQTEDHLVPGGIAQPV